MKSLFLNLLGAGRDAVVASAGPTISAPRWQPQGEGLTSTDAGVIVDQSKEVPQPVQARAGMLQPLHRLGDLPTIQGNALSVTTSLVDLCVVLDHGLTVTSLVGLPKAFQMPAMQTLRQDLASRSLKVVEYIADEAVFADVQRQLAAIAAKSKAQFAEELERTGASLYDELVSRAFRLGATDLHIYIADPNSSSNSQSHVRLRVAGRMREWVGFETHILLKALSSAYGTKSTLGTNSQSDYSVARPTSTMTQHKVRDKAGLQRIISTRFNSRPTVSGGAKATARILETDVSNVKIPTLNELGFEPSQIAQLQAALHKNQGLILLIGGTGGGKSTTLRTLMTSLPNSDELELYTVEDPVEYYLPGFANQLSIPRSSDEDEKIFRSRLLAAMRDLLRQDPDVAMIGEMRDGETTMLVTEIVNTGHRALTTMHGNGCIDGLDRLTGKVMQLEPTTLANQSFLSVAVYQKLVPLLCPKCKLPAADHLDGTLQQIIARKFKLDVRGMFVANPAGCPHCTIEELGIRGTKGMTVVAEVLTPERTLRDFIKARDWNAAADHWRLSRRTGFADPDMTGKTAFEHALYKAATGLVSVVDIETDFEPLATYEIMELPT